MSIPSKSERSIIKLQKKMAVISEAETLWREYLEWNFCESFYSMEDEFISTVLPSGYTVEMILYVDAWYTKCRGSLKAKITEMSKNGVETVTRRCIYEGYMRDKNRYLVPNISDCEKRCHFDHDKLSQVSRDKQEQFNKLLLVRFEKDEEFRRAELVFSISAWCFCINCYEYAPCYDNDEFYPDCKQYENLDPHDHQLVIRL